MAASSFKAFQKNVIISGGRGALGSACVHHFKSKKCYVVNIDVTKNRHADVNISVNNKDNCISQEKAVMQDIAGILGPTKVHAVICVAGGWIGGNPLSLCKQVDFMWKQSIIPSSIATMIAVKFLAPGGLLALSGAKSALNATPSMLGYGMCKAAIHQLTKSLASKDFSLPTNSSAVAILPLMLDTEKNREMMPKANFSSWTPVSFVAKKLMNWVDGVDRPPNGSLVSFETHNNITEIKIEDNLLELKPIME